MLRTLVAAVVLASCTFAATKTAAAFPRACDAPATRIHAIQGAGTASPLLGRRVTVDAVVVGAFHGDDGLGGFFVQEESEDVDARPETSEGLFVYDGDGRGAALEPGMRVRVRGRVNEFFGQTELSPIDRVIVCPTRGTARAARVRLPLADPAGWERWEGMRVRIDQTLVATGHHDLARFGETQLAAWVRTWQPTHRRLPGEPALAQGHHNARRRILLDDGSSAFLPLPVPHLERRDGSTLRLGDSVRRLEGVVEYAFGEYRIHPTRSVRFRPRNPRPENPPAVAGGVRLVVWNLENHFNGDGRGGGFPTRGPRNAGELERQRAKLVATLVRLAPDIAVLVELENDGTGPDSALRQLADALNRETFGAPYAVVQPPLPRLGPHAIAVGLLYRPSAAIAIGPAAVLDATDHPEFDATRNRPALAQSFEAVGIGQRFTVVANHWKSKGSPCDSAGDPDTGDGQGHCSGTRTRAARALVDWLATDPTGAGDAPAIIAGDLNAYPREDPVRALEAAGYVDLVAHFAGRHAYSYVFDGNAGRLDHALAPASLLPFVGGAAVWHTNADEPTVFGYGGDTERYRPDPFRASDHDPLLVGLFPYTPRRPSLEASGRSGMLVE